MLRSLAASRRLGHPLGIPSLCTAHETSLVAGLRHGRRAGRAVLIEATCNQVNPWGGYTGMTPSDFAAHVRALAAREELPAPCLILGGDHLGPNPWKNLPAEAAMGRAETMVDAYVRAGFTKLHLDASMGCAGEPTALDDDATAHRAARLAKVAEAAARDAGLPPPVYVIGTEVPVPGGADHVLDHVAPTTPEAARRTIAVHREVFARQDLSAAFDRVIALVVQPGVEFGHSDVIGYRPDLARGLTDLLDEEPQFVFEAHSTDYQTTAALRALVRTGFPILKVGPALTFAWREALYGLDLLAGELEAGYPAGALRASMEALMLAEPESWASHYHGTPAEQRRLRHFSYSDRIRYYWQHDVAKAAVARLMAALGEGPLPATLVSQFLPQALPADSLKAEDLLVAAVDRVVAAYDAACRPGRDAAHGPEA